MSSQLNFAFPQTHAAVSQAAMLALPAVQGDEVLRSDTNQTFRLKGTDPTNLSHWQAMPTRLVDETAPTLAGNLNIGNYRIVGSGDMVILVGDETNFLRVGPSDGSRGIGSVDLQIAGPGAAEGMYSALIAGQSNSIIGDHGAIIGAEGCSVTTSHSVVIGGSSHSLLSGNGHGCAVIGGTNHQSAGVAIRSAMIGGTGSMIGDTANTVILGGANSSAPSSADNSVIMGVKAVGRTHGSLTQGVPVDSAFGGEFQGVQFIRHGSTDGGIVIELGSDARYRVPDNALVAFDILLLLRSDDGNKSWTVKGMSDGATVDFTADAIAGSLARDWAIAMGLDSNHLVLTLSPTGSGTGKAIAHWRVVEMVNTSSNS